MFRKEIFANDRDREHFVELLALLVERYCAAGGADGGTGEGSARRAAEPFLELLSSVCGVCAQAGLADLREALVARRAGEGR